MQLLTVNQKKIDEKIVKFFLSIIKIEDKQILKTIRLGRKTDEDLNRPLGTKEIRNLRISPDRSLKEKEEVRNLVTKAKNLNDQEEGNYVYLVRGTHILKVKKKARLEN